MWKIFQKEALGILRYTSRIDFLKIPDHVVLSEFTEMKVTLKTNSVLLTRYSPSFPQHPGTEQIEHGGILYGTRHSRRRRKMGPLCLWFLGTSLRPSSLSSAHSILLSHVEYPSSVRSLVRLSFSPSSVPPSRHFFMTSLPRVRVRPTPTVTDRRRRRQ